MTLNTVSHPLRIQIIRHGVLRMKAALFAVGCMPFLCKVNMQAALRGGIKRTQLTVVQAVF